MSDLVRTAVERYISRVKDGDEISEEIEEMMDETFVQFDRFESLLNTTNKTMESLQEDQLGSESIGY
ncbi:hypothetical protein [Halosimplex salinum]|uniref:hypothetical protein n=1 Tax=Halosimplex salinum TaxID=1710538 RepID=UPI0013DE6E56|nr:hypothetical protein [Halosimplex salinum]